MKYNFYSNDIEITNNEVCIPSFHKYYNLYRDQYGFTYKSPNETIDSSNYGTFWDTVNSYLKLNNYEYDCRYPNSPYIGMWLNKNHTTGRHHYFNDFLKERSKILFYLDNSIKVPKVSKVIKELFNNDLHRKYIELKIKNEIKRFFILGGIGEFELLIDLIYKNGFNYIKKHFSDEIWEEKYNHFLRINNGEYGKFTYYPILLHSNLTTKENNNISIPLIGLNEKIKENNSENKLQEFIKERKENGIEVSEKTIIYLRKVITNSYKYNIERNELFYFSIWNEFDNIQYHEIIPTILYNEFIDTFRNPENEIREILGLPKIGEGWINETKLFYLIKERFKDYRVIQHGRPKWLGKQHLDIYLPDFNIGIEYQGEQHSISVEIFGGDDGLKNNQERDRRKKYLCEKNNLKLYEVFPNNNFDSFVDELSEMYLK